MNDDFLTILEGDAVFQLRTLETGSVQCVVTSPPYWGLRDYGDNGQLGLEKTPEEYVAKMVEVFREVRRVLRNDGTLWLNLGDSYAGSGKGAWDNKDGGQKEVYIPDADSPQALIPKVPNGLKPKDLCGIPWRVAFALQADGWWLRSDIIWNKPNPMPESVTDRPTKSHEYLFLMTKSANYFYDAEAIKEKAIYCDDDRKGRAKEEHKSMPNGRHNGIRPVYKDARSFDGKNTDKQSGHGRRYAGFNDRWDEAGDLALRNKRSVWTVTTKPYADAHFATYPPDLIKPCIMAGSRVGDTVLDPFGGSGTTGMVAIELGRKAILIELNPDYCKLINERCTVTLGLSLEA